MKGAATSEEDIHLSWTVHDNKACVSQIHKYFRKWAVVAGKCWLECEHWGWRAPVATAAGARTGRGGGDVRVSAVRCRNVVRYPFRKRAGIWQKNPVLLPGFGPDIFKNFRNFYPDGAQGCPLGELSTIIIIDNFAQFSNSFSLNVSGAVTTSARWTEAGGGHQCRVSDTRQVSAGAGIRRAASGPRWRPAEGINAVFLTPVRGRRVPAFSS